jgi:exopolysaccharide production protein ExoQ
VGGDRGQGSILMSIQKLKFAPSMIRKTFIYLFSGLLVIYRLLPEIGLRRLNCVSPITGNALACVGNFPIELLLWSLTILLIVWELISKKELGSYIEKWKTLWPVIPFILLALVSTMWSAAPLFSLERSIILISVSIAAVFIAYRNDLIKLVDLLGIYLGLIMAVCFFLISQNPPVGTMDFQPYNGAWRGIFWHRNYLGSYMSFASVVYLFNLFFREKKTWASTLFNFAGLAASIGLVFGSRSGAGILTLVLLLAFAILVFVWTRLKSRLKKWHYIVFGIVCIGLIIFVVTNLDFIFGLVGRNTSLTGRLPLWDYLYKNFISDRLFLGHGYGAIWVFEQFRVGLQTHLSWGYPVLIGDNGLIDIMLHLGLAGAFLMVLILGYALILSGKFAFHKKTGMAFFPLISLIFVLVSNISLSMLIELEFFTWSLLIMLILISSKPDSPFHN